MGDVPVVLTTSVGVGEDNISVVLVVSLVDNSVVDASVVGDVPVVLTNSVVVGEDNVSVVLVVCLVDN